MGIAVIYLTWDQCAPDDFEKNEHVKQIYPETTIGELIAWQKQDKFGSQAKQEWFDQGNFFPMRIVKME